MFPNRVLVPQQSEYVQKHSKHEHIRVSELRGKEYGAMCVEKWRELLVSWDVIVATTEITRMG